MPYRMLDLLLSSELSEPPPVPDAAVDAKVLPFPVLPEDIFAVPADAAVLPLFP